MEWGVPTDMSHRPTPGTVNVCPCDARGVLLLTSLIIEYTAMCTTSSHFSLTTMCCKCTSEESYFQIDIDATCAVPMIGIPRSTWIMTKRKAI